MLKRGVNASRKFARTLSTCSFSAENAVFLEELYRDWTKDPNSVHASFNEYFTITNQVLPSSEIQRPKTEASQLDPDSSQLLQVMEVVVNSFRTLGHYHAEVDPLKLSVGKLQPPRTLNISDIVSVIASPSLLEKPVRFISSQPGFQKARELWSVNEVISFMRKIYCGSIGFEFMHIPDPQIREWLQERIENAQLFSYSQHQKLDLLSRIGKTHSFSLFCERKYATAKRFGCEGLDAGVSGLIHLINQTRKHYVKNIAIGMAHRGRLNILACVLRKPLEQIFSEFDDLKLNYKKEQIPGYSGDVKYHLGANNKIQWDDGHITNVCLLPNPSHLEAVNSLLMGYCRALQTHQPEEVTLPVLIHGDAAICGQGVIYELQQMELLKNYSLKGTIHVIFNNQVGFTTDPIDLRSSFYASNIANLNQNFVMHVNADEPESVDLAFELALEYRMRFQRDVFIDLIGYRRAGHNEQDQPSFTQPQYYQRIKDLKPVYEIYKEKLIQEGVECETIAREQLVEDEKRLQEAHFTAHQTAFSVSDPSFDMWAEEVESTIGKTSISLSTFTSIGKVLTLLPSGHQVHRSIQKIYEERYKSIESGEGIEWALAEALAFGSLLSEGHSVRITGEDVERGTFSHRHAVITDQVTSNKYCPLVNLASGLKSATFEICNSLLSEYATMGFELGYSWAFSRNLVIWEGQFGDFANGAQIIIDQFITGAEKKWGRASSLVLLLPHGYDGQGPEHSNARLERFLAAVDDNYVELGKARDRWPDVDKNVNIRVCNLTTSANYFHALRRQVKEGFRKPLIIMSPKKLLRDRGVRSSSPEFIDGGFSKILDDQSIKAKSTVERLICCSGQIYFELLKEREMRQLQNKIALIRFEQIGPFPYLEFDQVISKYSSSARIIWASEESQNMGAFGYIENRANLILEAHGFKNIEYVGRPISSAPAVGKPSQHWRQHKEILEGLFGVYKQV